MKKTLSKKGTLVVLILEGDPILLPEIEENEIGEKRVGGGRWVYGGQIGLKKINLFIIFICLSIALQGSNLCSVRLSKASALTM
jgi:hypothetical protein